MGKYVSDAPVANSIIDDNGDSYIETLSNYSTLVVKYFEILPGTTGSFLRCFEDDNYLYLVYTTKLFKISKVNYKLVATLSFSVFSFGNSSTIKDACEDSNYIYICGNWNTGGVNYYDHIQKISKQTLSSVAYYKGTLDPYSVTRVLEYNGTLYAVSQSYNTASLTRLISINSSTMSLITEFSEQNINSPSFILMSGYVYYSVSGTPYLKKANLATFVTILSVSFSATIAPTDSVGFAGKNGLWHLGKYMVSSDLTLTTKEISIQAAQFPSFNFYTNTYLLLASITIGTLTTVKLSVLDETGSEIETVTSTSGANVRRINDGVYIYSSPSGILKYDIVKTILGYKKK